MAGSSRNFLRSVDYEVFGRVQGVFFRKNTKKTADKLGLVGWVKNTHKNTVSGCVQGPEEKMVEMRHWLSKVGSKSSRIEKCDFKNEKTISKLDFNNFDIRRTS